MSEDKEVDVNLSMSDSSNSEDLADSVMRSIVDQASDKSTGIIPSKFIVSQSKLGHYVGESVNPQNIPKSKEKVVTVKKFHLDTGLSFDKGLMDDMSGLMRKMGEREALRVHDSILSGAVNKNKHSYFPDDLKEAVALWAKHQAKVDEKEAREKEEEVRRKREEEEERLRNQKNLKDHPIKRKRIIGL